MSAAVATAGPAPSALLRRPAPAPQHAVAPRALRVTIVGQLLEDAHAGVEAATQRAAISVVLAQGTGKPVVLATLWLGDGVDAILEAEYQASLLPAGSTVRVEGDTLSMRYHRGALALSVGAVRGIARPQDLTQQQHAGDRQS